MDKRELLKELEKHERMLENENNPFLQSIIKWQIKEIKERIKVRELGEKIAKL